MKFKKIKKGNAATNGVKNTDHVAEAIKKKLMAMGCGFKCRATKRAGNVEFAFMPKQRVSAQR